MFNKIFIPLLLINNKIGNTHLMMNNYESALFSFEQCIGLHEGRMNIMWCNYIANLYFENKDYVNAERVYAVALKAEP